MTPEAVDRPFVVAEVMREFHAYEHALMGNDVDALIAFFWPDARLTRYGIADRQLGIDEMRAFRRATPAPHFTRRLENLRITAFGDDLAMACVEFLRSDTPLRGFQSQTWARLSLGDAPPRWFVVAAHVSMIPFATGDAG
jgi:hypothetical protein